VHSRGKIILGQERPCLSAPIAVNAPPLYVYSLAGCTGYVNTITGIKNPALLGRTHLLEDRGRRLLEEGHTPLGVTLDLMDALTTDTEFLGDGR